MNNNLISNEIATLKELFNEPLYFIKEEFKTNELIEKPIALAVESPQFQLLGENNKNIVFIVFSADKKLSEVDQELMNKTLVGLKLNKKDIAFCFSGIDNSLSFDLIGNALQNQRVICFGSTEYYKEEVLLKELTIQDSKLLPCPALTELSGNQTLKVQWWNALKAFVS